MFAKFNMMLYDRHSFYLCIRNVLWVKNHSDSVNIKLYFKLSGFENLYANCFKMLSVARLYRWILRWQICDGFGGKCFVLHGPQRIMRNLIQHSPYSGRHTNPAPPNGVRPMPACSVISEFTITPAEIMYEVRTFRSVFVIARFAG
jgi:hypothetical protein